MSIRRLSSIIIIFTLLLTASLALTQAQETTCDPATDTFAKGEALYAQGNYAGAVAAYTCALQTRTDSAALFNARGNAYRHMASYDQAVADYTRAIELDASNANFFNNRGYAEAKQGAAAAAFADFNRAIAIDPNLAYAYNNRGLIYAAQGQAGLAADDFNMAIALNHDPISWPIINLANLSMSPQAVPTAAFISPTGTVATVDDLTQGQTAYRSENYKVAIAAFTRAIDATPNSVYLFCERAGAYYMSGDYDNAIADYTTAIDLGQMPMHYVWRGNSYAHLGDNDKAFADYQSAIDHDPNYLNAYLYSATLHGQLSEKPAAAADFKRWLNGMESHIAPIGQGSEGERLPLTYFNGQEAYALTFTAPAGAHISAETNTNTGSIIDLVMILSTEGIPVAVDDDSGAGLNPQITDYSSSTETIYTLYVMGQGMVGPAELTLTITGS